MRMILLWMCAVALFLAGCGGGGGGGKDGNTVRNASFQIAWPARTRDVISPALSSAQSAAITLIGAKSGGGDVTVNVNRDPALLNAHTETYTVPVAIKKALTTLTINFYSLPDQAGVLVGTASGEVSLSGTGLEVTSVVMTGKVSSIAVLSPSTIALGTGTKQLLAAAKDAQNTIVAVSAGSIKWAVTSGATFLSVTEDGVATALQTGTAQVTATVDEVVSPAFPITITPPPPSILTVTVPVNDIAYDSVSGKLWATVKSTGGANANSVISIDPATGALGTPIPVGQEPNFIAVTGDGQFAYVTVDTDGTVRRVNLNAGTMGPSFSVNEGRSFVDLAAVPGSPLSFVVSIDPNAGVNTSVWDDGVRRTGTGATGMSLHFAGNNPALLYGDGGGTLFEDVLDSTSITWSQTDIAVAGFDYSVSDGLIYTRDGKAIDPVTKALSAQLSTANFLIDRLVEVGESDNRIYLVTWDVGFGKRILTFDRTTKAELPSFDTGVLEGGAHNLTACGNHTVAFNLFGSGVSGNVIIVKDLP